jgi:hypothetical protein
LKNSRSILDKNVNISAAQYILTSAVGYIFLGQKHVQPINVYGERDGGQKIYDLMSPVY